MLSKIKNGILTVLSTFISIIFCAIGTVADVVFIAALFNNLKIFEGNRLWVSAPVGEWGLAIIISLVGLFIMFSAGRRWAVAFSRRNKVFAGCFIALWALLGGVLAFTRVTLAANAGTLGDGLKFEAIILLLLFLIAGISMFAVSQNSVSPEKKNNARKLYATEEIFKLIEQCTLIENEQKMFISQIRQLNELKQNSIDLIITKTIINSFRAQKGIIVTEEEIPYKYMS